VGWHTSNVMERVFVITTKVTISISGKFISEIIINTNDLNWFSIYVYDWKNFLRFSFTTFSHKIMLLKVAMIITLSSSSYLMTLWYWVRGKNMKQWAKNHVQSCSKLHRSFNMFMWCPFNDMLIMTSYVLWLM
jgi:hypothetical protein